MPESAAVKALKAQDAKDKADAAAARAAAAEDAERARAKVAVDKIQFKKGGKIDGIAQRGKTRGRSC